jgi:hypothetical protein
MFLVQQLLRLGLMNNKMNIFFQRIPFDNTRDFMSGEQILHGVQIVSDSKKSNE